MVLYFLSLLLIVILSTNNVHAFALIPLSTTTATPRKSSSSVLHCICIDCKWVTKCMAYNFVETKHEQPHMTETPTFEPRNGSPTIHVNVRTVRTEQDREQEIQRMWKEHSSETGRAEEEQQGQELHGETVYDLSPVTTYEYDVVACEDFVQDTGCWVRNIPKEIREANPDFVPS